MNGRHLQEIPTGGNMSSLHWTEFNTVVMVFRFAGSSSAQHNAGLVDGLTKAYERYIMSASHPQMNIRASAAKGCDALDDFIDAVGVAHIYMVDNGVELVQIQLLGMATSAMNSNLIEEIKTVYKKYSQPLLARQQCKKR